MKIAEIGSFQISNVTGSTLTVGHCNDTAVADARRPADAVADSIEILDPACTETPSDYRFQISFRAMLMAYYQEQDFLDACNKLTEDDVKVELVNYKEVKTVHQIADLKIFVEDDKGGWLKFHHSIKLPKNAKLEEMEYSISEGVLTIIVPKEVKLAKPLNNAKAKAKRQRTVDHSMEEGVHEDFGS